MKIVKNIITGDIRVDKELIFYFIFPSLLLKDGFRDVL